MNHPYGRRLLSTLGLASILVAPSLHAQPVTSGLALRLEADLGVTLDLNGRVASWADQAVGVNGDNSATQAMASARPELVFGTFANHLSMPALRFDGTTGFFQLAGSVLTSQQFTIFVVASDTAGSGHREIFSNWDHTNSFSSVFFGTSDFGGRRGFRLSDYAVGGELENPALPQLLTGVSGVSTTRIFQGKDLDFTTSTLPGRNLATDYYIGTQGTYGAEFWQGDIGAVLVYDRELTQPEIETTWAYLDAKYLTAIPEPSAGAAIYGGLVLVGAWLRRRPLRHA